MSTALILGAGLAQAAANHGKLYRGSDSAGKLSPGTAKQLPHRSMVAQVCFPNSRRTIHSIRAALVASSEYDHPLDTLCPDDTPCRESRKGQASGCCAGGEAQSKTRYEGTYRTQFHLDLGQRRSNVGSDMIVTARSAHDPLNWNTTTANHAPKWTEIPLEYCATLPTKATPAVSAHVVFDVTTLHASALSFSHTGERSTPMSSPRKHTFPVFTHAMNLPSAFPGFQITAEW